MVAPAAIEACSGLPELHVFVPMSYNSTLDPPPPVGSKQKDVRYFHVHEDGFDEGQFADWAKQAARLPGEKM